MREKPYKIISVGNFFIHSLWVTLIFVATFLKFRENDNYYTVFTKFFGNGFVPYLFLTCLFGIAALCFLTLKKPYLSLILPIASFLLLNLFCFPYVFEVGFVNLGRPFISGGKVAEYGLGFEIIKNSHYIFYLDIFYAIYAFVYVIKTKNFERADYKRR